MTFDLVTTDSSTKKNSKLNQRLPLHQQAKWPRIMQNGELRTNIKYRYEASALRTTSSKEQKVFGANPPFVPFYDLLRVTLTSRSK